MLKWLSKWLSNWWKDSTRDEPHKEEDRTLIALLKETHDWTYYTDTKELRHNNRPIIFKCWECEPSKRTLRQFLGNIETKINWYVCREAFRTLELKEKECRATAFAMLSKD